MKKSLVIFFGSILCLHTSIYGQNVGVGEATPGSKFEIKGDVGTDLFNVKDQADDSKFYIQNDGDVGIGTTNPSYKLHVAGNVLVDNGGWLRVTGDQGIYFQDYGGGWRMQDNTWIRTYGDKSIYQNTGTLRTDGTFQIGGSGSTLNVPNGGNFAYRSDVLFANTSGNVGIGTASPSAQLHTTGSVRFQNYTNGILGVNASGNLVSRTLATSGNGVDISNANGVSGNPTISLDYGGSTTGGTYPQGNFGQFENHGTYSDFNTTPNYWGWNYVQGNTNAPNTISNQWYRGVFSLGGNYSARGTGGYSLELAYPRTDHSEAGVWMRTVENGSIGGWTRIDGSADNENFIHNQTASTQNGGFRIDGNGLFDGGNVGIGTTSPVSELEIEGGAQNWNTTTPGKTVGSIHLDPGSSSANIGNAITFGAHDTGGGDNAQAGIYVKSDGGFGTRMYLATTNSYATGAKTTMMLNHDGNVGIGTTSPGAKLHIDGTTLSENHVSLSAGEGKGFRFWNSDNYKIHMGSSSEYRYGPVQDYSIKTNMYNDNNRGWTWGIDGASPVMAVSATEGHMALKGALFLDCASCGSGTENNAFPNPGSGWGDAVLQGRVFSTNSNLHLSPPAGFNVIINDNYRAAGGTSSSTEAGLVVYGDAAINTSSLNGSYEFYVNGKIGSNGINETSDRRFKKDIQPLESSLEKIAQLQGVSYHWRQDEFPDREFKSGKDMGVIAQDVEKIFPEAVETDGDGYKSVQYSSLVPVLIEAVKEQKTIIEQLKNNHEQELNCLNQKIENYEELFEGIDVEAFKQAFAKENYTTRK